MTVLVTLQKLGQTRMHSCTLPKYQREFRGHNTNFFLTEGIRLD